MLVQLQFLDSVSWGYFNSRFYLLRHGNIPYVHTIYWTYKSSVCIYIMFSFVHPSQCQIRNHWTKQRCFNMLFCHLKSLVCLHGENIWPTFFPKFYIFQEAVMNWLFYKHNETVIIHIDQELYISPHHSTLTHTSWKFREFEAGSGFARRMSMLPRAPSFR